jgi:Tfp pilus assembly protein PilN
LARYLALDWDHKQLHVVAATVSGGKVRVQKAVVFAEEQSPNPAEAVALGQRLRAHLKEAGIAPAPVLACLGRDRVILKEVRYPKVGAAEEPALIRFQTAKELTEPIEEVILDYAPIGETQNGSEQRALVLIVRREMFQAYQALCQAAGLKLEALVPRPFGLVACLDGVLASGPGSASTPGARAVLGVAEQWAELCVADGDRLLFARALSSGSTQPGEVKRNLAVYSGQWPQNPLGGLYIADGEQHAALRDSLSTLSVPVQSFDSFKGTQSGSDLFTPDNASFAAAIGLLHAQAQRRPYPVNFVKPKEPKPPTDTSKRRVVIAASVAAALLIGVVGVCYAQLARKDDHIAELYAEKQRLDQDLLVIEEDAKRIAALEEWSQTNVVWLDEFYDLTDRFADLDNVRLVNLTIEPISHTAKARNGTRQAAARLSLKGIVNENDDSVDTLVARFVGDGHYTAVAPKKVEPNTSGVDRFRFRLQFVTQAEVERQSPDRYTRRLVSEANDKDPNGRKNRGRRRGGRGGGGGVGGAMDFGFGGGQP